MARHWTGARVILGASCRYLASLGIPSKHTMLDAVVGAAAVQSISVETVLGGGEAKRTERLKRWLVKTTGAASGGGTAAGRDVYPWRL